MKRIHCEPHETGIAFEYEGAMHRSSQKASVAFWAAGVFVLFERSRGTGPRPTGRNCRARSPDLDPFTAHPLAIPNDLG